MPTRTTAAPWDTAEIDQATGYFHLTDVLGPTLPLRVSVSGWKMSLHTTVAAGLAPTGDTGAGAAPMPMAAPGFPATDRIRVNAISGTGGEVTVRVSGSDAISLHGVMFDAGTHGGSQWTTDLQTTSIVAGTMQTGAGSVHLQSDEDKISFDNLTVHCGDGQIAGSGEVMLDGNHAIHGNFTASSVPLTTLVGARWQMKLSGLVSGTLAYQSDDSSATASGKMSVAGGQFNILPWLGKVTALVGPARHHRCRSRSGNRRFLLAEPHPSPAKHRCAQEGRLARRRSGGRVAGRRTVDGHLKVGLPSTVTARWPKLQTDIFSLAQDDYNWTDVHLTGTPDNLQEDLTPRLLALGASQGGDLIKSTSQNALNLINNLLK